MIHIVQVFNEMIVIHRISVKWLMAAGYSKIYLSCKMKIKYLHHCLIKGNNKPMKILKKIALFMLVVLFAIQFIRPEKNASETPNTAVFEQETNPPEAVMSILRSSCYDCHSANTKYPWYNNIAPVSFWIADHIEHGKGHLDFSNWTSYDAKKKDHKLEEVIETIEAEEMPLREYTWTHSEARLTDAQREAVIEWAESTRLLYQLGQKPQ